MRDYYDMATDERLIHMVRNAERRRFWFWRINWAPVIGGVIAITVSALLWWALIGAVIYVKKW